MIIPTGRFQFCCWFQRSQEQFESANSAMLEAREHTKTLEEHIQVLKDELAEYMPHKAVAEALQGELTAAKAEIAVLKQRCDKCQDVACTDHAFADAGQACYFRLATCFAVSVKSTPCHVFLMTDLRKLSHS